MHTNREETAQSYLTMRQASFQFAISQTKKQISENKGIGTLNEKTIHATLKNFYAPYTVHQEIKVCGYVADIMVDQEIIEIQTRNFNTMRKKLEAFLPSHEVTIVYPVAHTKWLSWINEETGEITKKRKSPKTGSLYQIIPELYRIKPFLSHPHLHFIIPLLAVEEYRLLNGWSYDKKRGATRHDGMPLELIDELYITQLSDYKQFLPPTLPQKFTTKDVSHLAKIPSSHAVTLLNILNHLEVVKRVGKKGNAYIYEKTTLL